jgi:hypothetical protein
MDKVKRFKVVMYHIDKDKKRYQIYDNDELAYAAIDIFDRKQALVMCNALNLWHDVNKDYSNGKN